MQQPPDFSLRHIRDFDQVLSFAFRFLRIHLRPFGRLLYIVAGPVVVLAALLNGMVLPPLTVGAESGWLYTILSWGINWLPIYTAQLVTCAYIVVSSEAGGAVPPIATVRNMIRALALRILLADLLHMLITFIGFFFFLIPGVYIAISLLLLPIIVAEEKRTVSQAFNRCFTLIQRRWWKTFGLVLVLYLALLVITIATDGPLTLLTLVGSISVPDSVLTGVLHVLSVALSAVGDIVVATVFTTAIAVHYYSIVEQREAPGLRERVEALLPPEAPQPEAPQQPAPQVP